MSTERPVTDALNVEQRARLVAVEAPLFDPPEYDGAIVGLLDYENQPHAAYDYDRLVEITIALNQQDPKTEEAWSEAGEHVDFNMVRGAAYAGPNRPLVMHELNPELPEPLDEGEIIVECAGKKWMLA